MAPAAAATFPASVRRKIYVECDRGGSRLPLQIVNTFVSNEMFYEIEKKTVLSLVISSLSFFVQVKQLPV